MPQCHNSCSKLLLHDQTLWHANTIFTSDGGSLHFVCRSYLQKSRTLATHIFTHGQGGRCWGTAGRAVDERSGSSTKGRPPTYAILLQNLVMSRFTRFSKGHHRAFYESLPALGVFSTKVSLLLKGFQQIQPAFGELFESPLSESFCRAFRELPES